MLLSGSRSSRRQHKSWPLGHKMGFISIQVYRESLQIGLRSLLRYAVVRTVAGKQDDGACTEVAKRCRNLCGGWSQGINIYNPADRVFGEEICQIRFPLYLQILRWDFEQIKLPNSKDHSHLTPAFICPFKRPVGTHQHWVTICAQTTSIVSRQLHLSSRSFVSRNPIIPGIHLQHAGICCY
jgi:hypothetical protein